MAASTPTRRAKQPESEEAPAAENPRTARSRERLERACELIARELESGEWVSSNEIHRRLSGEIADGLFGRAKKQLGVAHRRTKGQGGRTEYEWRLAKK